MGLSLFKCVGSMLLVAFTLCIILLILLILNIQKDDAYEKSLCKTVEKNEVTTEAILDHIPPVSPDDDEFGEREKEPPPVAPPVVEDCFMGPAGGNDTCISRACRREGWSPVYPNAEILPCDQFYSFTCDGPRHDSHDDRILTSYLQRLASAKTESASLKSFIYACEKFSFQHLNGSKIDLPENVTTLLAYLTLLKLNPLFDIDIDQSREVRLTLRNSGYNGDFGLPIFEPTPPAEDNSELLATVSMLDVLAAGDISWGDILRQLHPSINNHSQVLIKSPKYYLKLLQELQRIEGLSNKIRRAIQQYWPLRFWESLSDSHGLKFGCLKIANDVMKETVGQEYLKLIKAKDEYAIAEKNLKVIFHETKTELADLIDCLVGNSTLHTSLKIQLANVTLLSYPDSVPDEKIFARNTLLESTFYTKIKEAQGRYNQGTMDGYHELRSITYIKNLGAIYVPIEYMELFMEDELPSYILPAKIGFELAQALTNAIHWPSFETETFGKTAIDKQNPLGKHQAWDMLQDDEKLTSADRLAVRVAYNVAFRNRRTMNRLHPCYSPQQQFFITMSQQYCLRDLQRWADVAVQRIDLMPQPFRLSLALSMFPTFFKTFGCGDHDERCIV